MEATGVAPMPSIESAIAEYMQRSGHERSLR
jgi:hypothetical protein